MPNQDPLLKDREISGTLVTTIGLHLLRVSQRVCTHVHGSTRSHDAREHVGSHVTTGRLRPASPVSRPALAVTYWFPSLITVHHARSSSIVTLWSCVPFICIWARLRLEQGALKPLKSSMCAPAEPGRLTSAWHTAAIGCETVCAPVRPRELNLIRMRRPRRGWRCRCPSGSA